MGLLHIYNSFDDTHTTLQANGKIKDVLAGKYQNAVILKEGNRLTDEYEITENDVLFIRQYPQGTTALGVVAIVMAVVAAGVGVGAVIYSNKKSKEIQEEYEEQQRKAKERADKVTAFPFLKGTKNQIALGRTIPYIMGEMYFTPYLLNNGYYSIGGTDGRQQYFNGIYCCGYNTQKIKSVSIGNTKILEIADNEEQTGSRTIQHATYGTINIDIENDGELTNNAHKVVGEFYGDEIKHDYGHDAEPLIKQLPENVQKVEVCLRYDGLRQFNDENGSWENRTVEVVPYWSNNADAQNPTWHAFNFTPSNSISRNVNTTIRFTATHEFTAIESYGKNISIKLVRTTPKLENGNANETAILEYVNTFCYDAVKSSASSLVACKPLENPFRDQTLRMSVKIESNESTNNIIDEINIITTGTARTLSNGQLSETKTITRNPVAWIIELLTNDFHKATQYTDNELKLSTFQTAYNYCETNNFYCDYVLTEGTKKLDIIEKIVSSIGASLIVGSDGLLEIAIDKAENTPVALLNSQSVKSITYAKTLEHKITGLKTTYTNRESWSIATEYFMLDGRTTYDQSTDRLSELALDTVTTHDHAYKVAQRQQRQVVLQPRTIHAEVGLEGELYPLYSTILLQMEQLKQGIASTVIHDVIRNDQEQIIKLVVADYMEFVEGNRYGIILQMQNNYGKQLVYKEVTGEGKTNVLELVEPLTTTAIQPEYNNQLSFGLLTEDGEFVKVTNTMKIYGIEPSGEHSWNLELKDYNPAIYQYGTIPEYKSNLTTRPTTEKQLPTITQSMLDAARLEANGFTRQVGEGLSARIDDIVTTVTVCSADLTTAIYNTDGSGHTVIDETTEINIDLRQGEEILDFTLGQLDLPEGFSYTLEGKKLILHIAQGTKIKAGTIKIPVIYKAIVAINNYVDENGDQYVDENGEAYVEIVYSDTSTTFPLYFTIFGNGGGQYMGSYNNIGDLPELNNIGDYIVWIGENEETALVKEGAFIKAAIYKYSGTNTTWRWELDEDDTHLAIAFKDVVGTNNDNLEQDNPKAYDYVQNLAANNIFANSIKAKEGFFDNITVGGNAEIGGDVHVKGALGETTNAGQGTGTITAYIDVPKLALVVVYAYSYPSGSSMYSTLCGVYLASLERYNEGGREVLNYDLQAIMSKNTTVETETEQTLTQIINHKKVTVTGLTTANASNLYYNVLPLG